MYLGKYVELNFDWFVFIMVSIGEFVMYREYEVCMNQFVYFFCVNGLGWMDYYFIFMENNN